MGLWVQINKPIDSSYCKIHLRSLHRGKWNCNVNSIRIGHLQQQGLSRYQQSCWRADNVAAGPVVLHAAVTVFANTVEARFGVGIFRHLLYEQRFILSPSGEERYALCIRKRTQQFVMPEKHKLVLYLRRKTSVGMQICRTLSQKLNTVSALAVLDSINEETFPDTAVNEKLLPHAKEGWELLRATNRRSEEYPQKMSDLFKRAMAQRKPMGEI
jgi:hypothetical protein